MTTVPMRPAPTSRELAVWRRFVQVHAMLVHTMAGELADSRLSLHHYDVLAELADAPEHRLRMADLADRLVLSRSGLTRLADRLERDGLIRRESCPTDGRGTYVALLPTGVERLDCAAPAHLEAISRHFAAALEGEELGEFGRLLDKIFESITAECQQGAGCSESADAADAADAGAGPPC